MAIFSAPMYTIRRKPRSGQNGQKRGNQLAKGQSGRTAVAAAAYAAGVRLQDERTGRVHDFRAKSGVYQSFIVGGGGWGGDTSRRAALWNAAEAAELRTDSVTAREWIIAMPHELTHEQREALARQVAQDMANRWGVVVDCSLHMPSKEGDQRNFHAHFLMTTRSVNADGSFGAKTRVLDNKWSGGKSIAQFREQLAGRINDALAAAGHAARVDHRTLKEQGIERKAQIHEGVNATNARRRNYKSKDELAGKETRRQMNELAGIMAAHEYHEALRLLREQRLANDKELAALAANKLNIPRKYHRAAKMPRFTGGKKPMREDSFLLKVLAMLIDCFAGALSAAQVAYAAAEVVEQRAQDMQRAKAIRAQTRAIKTLERQLMREVNFKEGKGDTGNAGAASSGKGGRKKNNWRMRSVRESYAVSPDDLAATVGDALAAKIAACNAKAAEYRAEKWRQRYSSSTKPPQTGYTVDEFGNVPTPEPPTRPRRTRPQKAAFDRFAKKPQDRHRPNSSPNT